jgi:ABC-type transporter Mla MlaB component
MSKEVNIIKLRGNLESRNVSEIEDQLEESLSKNENVLIDLDDLEKLDIAGVFMLLMLKKRAMKECKKVSFSLPPSAKITENVLGISIPELV